MSDRLSPQKREARDYLNDIVSSVDAIKSFTKGMRFRKFATDVKTIFAVVRALEIIGEAVRNLPADVKKKHPDMAWAEMIGMRNKLAHEYFGVDTSIVWQTIKTDLPPLRAAAYKLLKDLGDNPRD
ncbi:MAG TPA: DUF86 domain-containing protein [bacterium]|nr:DUF86 domain-containing protein [bacterium]